MVVPKPSCAQVEASRALAISFSDGRSAIASGSAAEVDGSRPVSSSPARPGHRLPHPKKCWWHRPSPPSEDEAPLSERDSARPSLRTPAARKRPPTRSLRTAGRTSPGSATPRPHRRQQRRSATRVQPHHRFETGDGRTARPASGAVPACDHRGGHRVDPQGHAHCRTAHARGAPKLRPVPPGVASKKGGGATFGWLSLVRRHGPRPGHPMHEP